MYYSLTAFKLIRYSVAYVFIISALMKFFSYELGNYFVSLGLPIQVKTVVAFIEIICAILILMNKYIKYSTIPLLVIMISAILLTKVPLLHQGFLTFAFQARLDILMIVLLFILYKSYPKEKLV